MYGYISNIKFQSKGNYYWLKIDLLPIHCTTFKVSVCIHTDSWSVAETVCTATTATGAGGKYPSHYAVEAYCAPYAIIQSTHLLQIMSQITHRLEVHHEVFH
jgi:hypothetical protein